jgi:membrane associated rhomboid family serine protease
VFLPIGDTPNPRDYRAWVTWSLMAANIAVWFLISAPLTTQRPDPADPLLREYLRLLAVWVPDPQLLPQLAAQVSLHDLFTFVWGYKPGAPETRDLFASLFLHGSASHLAGNMLFLWIYGDNVEHRLGRLPFLLLYLASGVAATLAFGAFAGDSLRPLVGASGAISGVLGVYLVCFPRNHVKFFVFLFPLLVDTWLVPAWLVLLGYLFLDNLLPLLSGAGGAVAHGAHIGGFLAGAVVAALLYRDRGTPGRPRGGTRRRAGQARVTRLR